MEDGEDGVVPGAPVRHVLAGEDGAELAVGIELPAVEVRAAVGQKLAGAHDIGGLKVKWAKSYLMQPSNNLLDSVHDGGN